MYIRHHSSILLTLSKSLTMQLTSRRTVLKTLGLAGGAVLFSPNTLLSCTQKKKDKLGVALVGLGYYSTDLLAPALQQTKNCYLSGIVTGTPSKAETGKLSIISR
jgi:glucose-fructose oxidoreductase